MATKKSRTSKKKSSKRSVSFGKFKFRKGVLFVSTFAIVGALALAVSMAAPRCTPEPPQIQIHNTYKWASSGSWGKPGQKLAYGVTIYNSSCSNATLTGTVSAPSGFTVDQQPISAFLHNRRSKYFTVYVTSPISAAVTDYPITATVNAKTNNGSVAVGNTDTNYFKVYTSDTTPPEAYWPSHRTGDIVSGTVRLLNNFTDDHMPRKVNLYINGTLASSSTNDGVTVHLTGDYSWETDRIPKGQYTITWKAYDDFNNEVVDSWVLVVQ